MTVSSETARALGDPVLARSIEVLKAGQSPSGALVASPDFTVYRYAWLRDGAFCAHALDLVGERSAASAWHRWVAGAIETHRPIFERAVERVGDGDVPAADEMPPARYTLDGEIETESGDTDSWPNFQVDGYGMWLWSLAEHGGAEPLPGELSAAVELAARYLAACGLVKCFNCWEEFDGGESAATLASVAAGLRAAARLLGDPRYLDDAARVERKLVERFSVDGRFRRGPADDRVDGSLLWLSVPFAVPDAGPRIRATVEAVRRDLAGPGGGVYRFLGDTYYGGGQWLLLTSWLAWHDALAGDLAAAERGQAWVRAQATEDGDLPEQVCGHPQDAAMVDPWIERWGPVATPLLWSHAMYVIAESARA